MLCGWEGHRRSGVALAVRHRLSYGLNGLGEGDEHPVYTPLHWSTTASLPLPAQNHVGVNDESNEV